MKTLSFYEFLDAIENGATEFGDDDVVLVTQEEKDKLLGKTLSKDEMRLYVQLEIAEHEEQISIAGEMFAYVKDCASPGDFEKFLLLKLSQYANSNLRFTCQRNRARKLAEKFLDELKKRDPAYESERLSWEDADDAEEGNDE